MTKEEIQELLLSFCDKEISHFNKTRLFLYRKNIRLAATRLLETWERNANYSLPDKICFPKDTLDFKLDNRGVHFKSKVTSWSDILFTALAVHTIDRGKRGQSIQNYFLAYTNKGDIINQEIGDIKEYSNLLGHFIELYKSKSSNI